MKFTYPLMATGAIALLLICGGCSLVARRLATENPGMTPRDGQVARISSVGSEQVRVTFSFKVGPDHRPLPSAAEPGTYDNSIRPDHADVVVSIAEAMFVDTTGRQIEVIDREVLREANTHYVSFTSGAVHQASYQIICQSRILAGGYQVKLATLVTREIDAWRADPQSFQFAVYGPAERRSWWHFNILAR